MAKPIQAQDFKPNSKTNRLKHRYIPRRSVRGRLTLLNLVLLTLLFIVLCLAQYFLLANFLKNSLINSLQTEARPVIEQRTGLAGDGPFNGGTGRNLPPDQAGQRILSDLNGKTTLAVIIDPNRRVIKPTSAGQTSTGFTGHLIQVSQTLVTPEAVGQEINLDQLTPALDQLTTPPADLLERALKGETGLSYTTSLSGWDNAVVVLIPFTVTNPTRPPERGQGQGQQPARQGTSTAVLVFAGSNAANENALADLLLINAGAFGVLLLVIGLISPLVAGSSLRPLRRMIRTTQQIAAGDLSQRVQLESDRDEIGQLAVSFNRMVDQLEHQFKMQRQLVADASHELRTPLTAIKGSLEVMLLGGTASNPEAADRLLKTMHKESVRLTRLVNDLLTLSKLDQGESIHLQPVNLLNLTQEVKASIELFIQQGEKPVNLRLEGFPAPGEPAAWVLGAPERLKQVLYNLLDNAVKFSPPHATVTLELQQPVFLPSHFHNEPVLAGPANEQKYYRLAVRDQGPGIPAGDLPHIFDRFYRGDASRSRRNGGSGLGLAIAQALLAAQGGYLEVESRPEVGSVFYVYLPAVKEILPGKLLTEQNLSQPVS